MNIYESASKSPQSMAVMVAYCIAFYLEQHKIVSFTTEEMKQFIDDISEDIEVFLVKESPQHEI